MKTFENTYIANDKLQLVNLTNNDNYKLYRITDEYANILKIPTDTYIVSAYEPKTVLYRPYIAGIELHESMEKVGELLVKIITNIALKGKKARNLVELVYLSGGLFYFINHGFKKVHNIAIPQCFIGIQRSRIEGTVGQFTAKIAYENFEALPDNATVIIGDTIATGATMAKGLLSLESALKERSYTPEQIIICTLAGATEGLRKIKKISDSMKTTFQDLKICIIACEQLFTLMPDGTDLRFFGNDSIIPPETEQYTIKEYGEWLGRNMKCAVFDWGTRCKNPIKHYEEFIQFSETLINEKQTPHDARLKLQDMINKTIKLQEQTELTL